MKNKLKIIITLIVIGFLAYYISSNFEQFKIIKNLKTTDILIFVILQILFIYSNGLIHKIFAKIFSVNLKEAFGLSAVTSFLNLITPFKGGTGFRALFLKKIHKIDYKKFIALIYAKYVIISLFLTLLGAITSFLIDELYLGIIFLLASLLCLIIIKFHFRLPNKNKILQNINKILESWEQIAKHKGIKEKLGLITIFNLMLTSLINFFTLKSLGASITFLDASFLAVIGSLSFFIQITPGGLGITEGAYYLSTTFINISGPEAITAALIIRLSNAITLIPIGIYYYFKLNRTIKEI